MNETLDTMMRSWADQVWAALVGGAVAHPASVASLDVDSSWILDEWEREFFVRLLIQARGGSVRFVESTPGGGRSHFLHLLAGRARTAGLATLNVAEQRQLEIWRDPLCLYQEAVENLLPNQSPKHPGLLSLVAERGQPTTSWSELFPEFPTWGLALQLWVERRDPTARKYLLGLSFDETVGAEIGLHARLTSRQAGQALRCLLCCLEYCGESGLVILADGDGHIEGGDERPVLESLRNLIDSCSGGEFPAMLLVCAVLPEFRQQLVPEYEALQQRLHNGFSFGPAGCLRPILVLEQQRAWRATQGTAFLQNLSERVHRLALRTRPELATSPTTLRRNLESLLAELPWDEASPGAPRGVLRTLTRWFSDPFLPLDSSTPESHSARLSAFLDEEAF